VSLNPSRSKLAAVMAQPTAAPKMKFLPTIKALIRFSINDAANLKKDIRHG